METEMAIGYLCGVLIAMLAAGKGMIPRVSPKIYTTFMLVIFLYLAMMLSAGPYQMFGGQIFGSRNTWTQDYGVLTATGVAFGLVIGIASAGRGRDAGAGPWTALLALLGPLPSIFPGADKVDVNGIMRERARSATPRISTGNRIRMAADRTGFMISAVIFAAAVIILVPLGVSQFERNSSLSKKTSETSPSHPPLTGEGGWDGRP